MTKEINNENKIQQETKPVNTDDSKRDSRPMRPPRGRFGDRKRSEKDSRPVKTDFEILERKKVSRTVAGGRRMRFSVLLVSKIAKGVIGIGYSKANEAIDALNTAITKSKQKSNVFKVHMFEGRTFSHAARSKFGATELMLLPSGKEKGLKALGVARKLAKMAGIQDGVVKIITKASSRMNICHAFKMACELMTPNTSLLTSLNKLKNTGGAV